MKVNVEIEIDFLDVSDDGWICGDDDGDVMLTRKGRGEPKYNSELKMWQGRDWHYTALQDFFTLKGIKSENSLMRIGEFKERFCK